ncbi:MAG: hypothetical protein IT521_10700 [Burkholderiales bacterium]|nr:hypothetical protein [Burkholderiales bacterium]
MRPARTNPIAVIIAVGALTAACATAQCPPQVPAQGAALPGPLPLFPADNGWNLDVSAAPVDPASASFIAFIDNGGTRHLRPDFGGVATPSGSEIYGMPYAVVDGAQPKLPVHFDYPDESDGVDSTGRAIDFYPIPARAIGESQWIEGGAPGSVDQRSENDRHLLIVDCTHRHLYELYNVYHDSQSGRWYAGSGAFFDLDSNARRPEGWTSADAAGLAILPGLVRYDEAWNPAVTDIGHAFRVTVRATNGYVFPASHRAGSTAGALPMGARLRLKAVVDGKDPALRSNDPNVRKIFRALQKHGLIVADNGSDLYVTGTFDTRWNNDILNPAFALLTARDFDIIRLGWNPRATAAALASIALLPSAVAGGRSSFAVVTLSAPAGGQGARVLLRSSNPELAAVPATVVVAAGATSAHAMVKTRPTRRAATVTLSADLDGTTQTSALTVSVR